MIFISFVDNYVDTIFIIMDFFNKNELNTALDYLMLRSHYCLIKKGYAIKEPKTPEEHWKKKVPYRTFFCNARIKYKKQYNITLAYRYDNYSYYLTVAVK